jgi:hypothetical protein
MSMERVRRTWMGSDLLKRRVRGLALTLCDWETLAGHAAGHLADTPMAPAPGSRRIERRDDHLSVSAREAPWAAVLNELQHPAGIRCPTQVRFTALLVPLATYAR